MSENNELRTPNAKPLARITPIKKAKISKPGDLILSSGAKGTSAAKPLLIVPQQGESAEPKIAPPTDSAPSVAPVARSKPAGTSSAPPVRVSAARSKPKTMTSEARRALMMRYLNKRYTLLGPLGSGGMGMVFKAKDKLLGIDVAVKAVPPELTRSPSAVESLKNEARLAMSLSHDNIVRLYHFDIEKRIMFLVMEYVDGKDFRAVISANGALPAATALGVAASMASAIDYAHSRDVLHRDLKPENIMLNSQGILKIVDFGTARRRHFPELRADSDFVEGTPIYSPPEQFTGAVPHASADIYAFGAVIQELLCGLPIFPETISVKEQCSNPPAELPDGFPANVNQVFRRCLARNPEERWATAGEFVRQLRDACAASNLIGMPDASASPAQ